MDGEWFRHLIEWVWVPMVAAIVRVWVKVTGLETRSALIDLAHKHHEDQMDKIDDRIGKHTDMLSQKIDRLEQKIDGKADRH